MIEKYKFPVKIEVNPVIYAYELPDLATHKDLLKVGYTERDSEKRIDEQTKTANIKYKIHFSESSVKNDGSVFTDKDLHRYLKNRGFSNPFGEWFKITLKELKGIFNEYKEGKTYEKIRYQNFGMRPEQEVAINKTIAYFESIKKEKLNTPSHFLWNAKMRFGKTFTTYQLAKKMNWKKVFILTFKPAVHSAWEEDLNNHVDFEGWTFVSKKAEELTQEDIDNAERLVCFGSFQDYLGRDKKTNSIKSNNEWVYAKHWDCIIFDEFHYGAWRERAQNLFSENNSTEKVYTEFQENYKELYEAEGKKEIEANLGEGLDYFKEDEIPISTDHFLYLSGTPFRALKSGEFMEEQIFNWTYTDEQTAKETWKGDTNPYLSLPKLVMMTYKIPAYVTDIAENGEFNEFSLNEFFKAEGIGENAVFKHKNEVQKWLEFIRGSLKEEHEITLKLAKSKAPMPFSDSDLKNLLQHTFWLLPDVASCYAMHNLLKEKTNAFFSDYEIIVAAGNQAGIGLKALEKVQERMKEPLSNKSITLSCGKLTTGVSVKPWSGIFMLRNLSSPETYFQAAFRVQTPWTITNPDDKSPNKTLILKENCYVFDFDPNRALKQLADYSNNLNLEETNIEKKVEDFISFLPVLSYEDGEMIALSSKDILDKVFNDGMSATLLARRWQSFQLVNVSDIVLNKILNNEDALKALENIEDFRNLNSDIVTIITKSDTIKKLKKEASERPLSENETKKLTEEEKEYKSKRKQIQQKLIKLATRIPIFMYLTDYREHALKDVIRDIEPALFHKVTGLSKKDFDLLLQLGVFDEDKMNTSVLYFKRYEDNSLTYTGISKHEDLEVIGAFSTTTTKEDYNKLKI